MNAYRPHPSLSRYRFAILLAALAVMLPARLLAFAYPALDTLSHWSIQDWGYSQSQGFYVQGASKSVWDAPGQAETKTAFYNLAFLGARLGGREYRITGQDYMGEMEGSGYLGKYGNFHLTADLNVTVLFAFHDDGKFEAMAYFNGAGYVPGTPYELVLRLDYDMAGSGNNIAEFLWNSASEGRAVSPPQVPRGEALDGRLVFAPAAGSGASSGASYWSATSHEISVAYPPLAREAGSGIENAGFARILNASNPQFGMVLWGDGATSVEATFKAYGYYDGTLNPQADVAVDLQQTGESGGYPRYAYAGRDQMLFLRLGSSLGTYKFGGKLFQRPFSRPLAVTVHQHPPQDLGGWDFDPDMVARYTRDGARTFRNALGDLAGSQNVSISRSGSGDVPYLPYDGYAAPGRPVTEAQLHNLMTASRNYSTSSLEDVREWRIDLYLVNWTLQGEPGAWEAMFDHGGADANGISREGAAVFWPALGGRGDDFQRRQSILSELRGTGLALNMDAGWSSCPFVGYCWNDGSACGGMRCGPSCPSGAQGCRYSAYTCLSECAEGSIMSFADADHNTMRFNPGKALGSIFSEWDWYQKAPEAWVKPGRFGIGPINGARLPPFNPN